ncbi:GAF domain-containing protein [Steroidobacter sp. S1-65]|uniref:histidine kinase n=1 Tax=Steroidobacter gossypii TaxID=2805490 RepID=A0ABS1X2H9_9GAMM|nr:ATP-binding protein [Steroidobacter gossypii]MBM0107434.1 GAF domain-containing protein [Steroidobacter gossypii]
MVSAALTSDLNLDLCAQEPIRTPGSIQPHGMLVVVDPLNRCIVQASANAKALLGRDRGSSVLGLSLAELVGESAEDQIHGWLANPDSSYLRTLDVNGRRLQVLRHQTPQGIILEFEQPPASEGETLEAYYPRVGRFMEDLPAYENVAELCSAAAREFRQISGFNRVLIYRFDEQWNGEVLAEDGDGVLPSYAGLRFPATDIPAQARELYRLNRLRVIPDANYTPVPMEPSLHPADGKPLDLSFAALRSVSPVHLQYMRNMGTLASMSISVLVDDRLWGLVSCHNATPRRVNAQARTACDLLGKVLSQHIGARDRGAYAARRIDVKRIESELLARIAANDSFQSGLAANANIWLKIADATGAAVLHDDTLFTAGVTPAPDRLRALAEQLQQRTADHFVTDSLVRQWPEFEDIVDVASGVLAISISQLHPSYILWFRPEVQRTVLWAGDPSAARQEENERLTPRHSFASWKERVKNRALPWSQAELDGALEFRNAIINFVLRRAEERAELTSQLQRSNRELESFSYSVSHDLRAPFRHIVGYTQLLRDRERSLSEQSQHYLDSINEAAASAGQLVDDLLAFSQLGRTALSMGPVDMHKVVQEIVRSVEPDVRNRQIEWRIQSLPPATGDAALLRQALFNIIDNALKYSRDRSPAVIEIVGEQRPNESIYIVRDNGVGFDMAYAHKLFGVFQRLHRMEDFAGTGIGLALTQRIVERHGGWIEARGAIDRGAEFRFGIPRQGDNVDG